MAKEQFEHTDKLGNKLKIGDKVAAAHKGNLKICTVTKLNRKMIKIVPITKVMHLVDGYNIYSSDAVLIDGPRVSMYILKNTS